MKYKLLAVSFLLSSTAFGNSYQSITDINYGKLDGNYSDIDSYSINSQYYFSPKKAIGPIDQFSYINTVSNLNIGYSLSEYSNERDIDSLTAAGALYLDNFVIAGRHMRVEGDNFDSESSVLELGYLFSNNLQISSAAIKVENRDISYQFLAKYNVEINETDYLGFSVSTDEDFDSKGAEATFFTRLADDQYLKLSGEITDDEYIGTHWLVKGHYYFSKYTSVYLQQQKDDYQQVGVKHFLNDHFALSASYTSNDNHNDSKIFNIGLTAQF